MSDNKCSAYSPLKIFHHQKELEAMKTGGYTAPIHVQLIISDLCNQYCDFCAYRMPGYSSNVLFGEPDVTGHTNPNRQIELGKCVEILEDCKKLGTKAVQFTGGGEPTVHTNHEMIFQECLDRDMDLALVTNGVRLGKESLRAILMQASWVRISLDAGIKETYAKIRRVDPTVFDRVWQNVEGLVNARERYEIASGVSSDLLIGIGFVVTKDNWKEVIICTQRAKEAGVDNVRISALFQNDGIRYFEGWLEDAAELCQAAATLSTASATGSATGGFKVFNNFSDRVDDLLQKSPDYEFCGIQNVQTYIGADLNLYRCCVLAYNPRGIIGSLKDQSFYDLWKSKSFEGFDARKCPRCMYNNKNKTILYAIHNNALHRNFV